MPRASAHDHPDHGHELGLLFGGFYVLLSTPLAAVLATLVDVAVLNKDPAKQEVPKLIFPKRDAETS